MSYFIKAAELAEVTETKPKILTLQGRQIAIFRIGDEIHALENVCPHRGGPIGEGMIKDGKVTCPWHDWTFDIRTGKCTFNASVCLLRFPVKVEGSDILVLPEPEG